MKIRKQTKVASVFIMAITLVIMLLFILKPQNNIAELSESELPLPVVDTKLISDNDALSARYAKIIGVVHERSEAPSVSHEKSTMVVKTIVGTTTQIESIHPELPLMEFELSEIEYIRTYSNEYESTLRYISIAISLHETGEVFQVIRYFSVVYVHSLIFEDLNFDGYKDIRHMMHALIANNHYYCWLYDKEAGQFIYSPVFRSLSNIMVDTESQIIRSSWRNGYYTELEYYEFADNALIPIEKESVGIAVMDENGNTVHCDITYKMIAGEWVEVSRLPTRAFG